MIDLYFDIHIYINIHKERLILSAQPKEYFSLKYGLEDTVKSPTLFYNIDYVRNYESHGGLNHKASNLCHIRVRHVNKPQVFMAIYFALTHC